MNNAKSKQIKRRAPANAKSWELNTWPDTEWPHTERRARWVCRAYRKELISAGAMSRVGKTIVIIGVKYTRWLEKRSRSVVEFESNNPAIGKGFHMPSKAARLSYIQPTPDEVKAFRERHGLTQPAAAHLAMASLRAWCNWESGVSRMHPAIWAYIQSMPRDP